MEIEKAFKSQKTFRQKITSFFKVGSVIIGFSLGIMLGLRYRRQYYGILQPYHIKLLLIILCSNNLTNIYFV